mgnify:CR=1 FL=1
MTEKRDRFSHAMEQCRQDYRDTPVPPELERGVEEAIRAGSRARMPRLWLRRTAAAAAGLCACFVVFTSPAVASAVDGVPVLGTLCRILTGEAYQSREETNYVRVQLPQMENTGDSSLEQRVNLEINAVIHQEVERSKERAEEYYQAYLDTGGDPDTFQPIQIQVDYQVKSVTDQWASFVITKTESLASAYFQQYFYNIDLETGQKLTLRDLLGPDWANQVQTAVEEQLEQWDSERQALLFDNVDWEELLKEKGDFYLQTDGTVVVVFAKYELAAGAAGVLEFPVGMLPQA